MGKRPQETATGWRTGARNRVILVTFSAGLFATACGSDSAPASTSVNARPSTTSTATSTTTTSTTAPPVSSPDSVEAPTTAPVTTVVTETTETTAPPITESPAQPVRFGNQNAAASGFDFLSGQRVAVLAHAASTIDGRHIVDVLAQAPQVKLAAIFSPEHGLRGDLGSGVEVESGVDSTTGVAIHSLYGDTKAPTDSMLDGIDTIVVDLQDVGGRYYTYISTLGLTMQAAARNDVAVVVLDRPNPLGMTSPTGFMRAPDYESFVSKYPIPSQYAMTIGELAQAIKGEGWLDGVDAVDLTVIPMTGWQHSMRWDDTGRVWTPPSPGLQTTNAALLYPALVMFEPTTYSYGSGTNDPFTAIAAPWANADDLTQRINALAIPGLDATAISFTPMAIPGMNQDPAYEGQTINGTKLTVTSAEFNPWSAAIALLSVCRHYADDLGQAFIDDKTMFDLLAGSSELRSMVTAGESVDAIAAAAANSVAEFEPIRARYLLYP